MQPSIALDEHSDPFQVYEQFPTMPLLSSPSSLMSTTVLQSAFNPNATRTLAQAQQTQLYSTVGQTSSTLTPKHSPLHDIYVKNVSDSVKQPEKYLDFGNERIKQEHEAYADSTFSLPSATTSNSLSNSTTSTKTLYDPFITTNVSQLDSFPINTPPVDNEEVEEKKGGRRKIKIQYIDDKSRRHITFSKRKAGIMKKAYELSTLTGTQVLLLVASETGHIYSFATPSLQPLITKPEGKALIQNCLNSATTQQQHRIQPRQQQQLQQPNLTQPMQQTSLAQMGLQQQPVPHSQPAQPQQQQRQCNSPLSLTSMNIPSMSPFSFGSTSSSLLTEQQVVSELFGNMQSPIVQQQQPPLSSYYTQSHYPQPRQYKYQQQRQPPQQLDHLDGFN